MKSTRKQFVKTFIYITAIASLDLFAVRPYIENMLIHRHTCPDPTTAHMITNSGVTSYVTQNGLITQASEHQYNRIEIISTKDQMI